MEAMFFAERGVGISSECTVDAVREWQIALGPVNEGLNVSKFHKRFKLCLSRSVATVRILHGLQFCDNLEKIKGEMACATGDPLAHSEESSDSLDPPSTHREGRLDVSPSNVRSGDSDDSNAKCEVSTSAESDSDTDACNHIYRSGSDSDSAVFGDDCGSMDNDTSIHTKAMNDGRSAVSAARTRVFHATDTDAHTSTDSNDTSDTDPRNASIVTNAKVSLVDDITADGEVMTEGCGIVSRTLMRLIHNSYVEHLRKKSKHGTPSAFQARFGPCKGMFVEWPDGLIMRRMGTSDVASKSPPLYLLVRPSQKKYNMANLDLEQCAVEILNISKPGNPGYLSQMYVPLLWQRGVEESTFKQLAREAFVHHVERAVLDQESTLNSIRRMQRNWRDERIRTNPAHKIEDEETWHPPHWITAGMIMSGGFSAATEPSLAQQMLQFAKQKLSRFLNENRIPMARSRSLFMVPDESGVLGPDECFIQLSAPPNKHSWSNLSSKEDLEDATMPVGSTRRKNKPWDFTGVMSGPIVALRSPSYHHSDVVKLKAVDRPLVRQNLGHLCDVIVLSTKKLGERSPAAVMSGGDYDGDKASEWGSTVVIRQG